MASTDPLTGTLAEYLPMLLPLFGLLAGEKEHDFMGRTIRLPSTLEGMAEFAQTVVNSLDREALEGVMGPVAREAENFHRALAFNINRGLFGMDDARAMELARNRVSGGRFLAFVLGRASGADRVLHNMEVAARRAGVRPTSVAGFRAKARNQRVSAFLARTFSLLTDPSERGRLGVWSAVEASRATVAGFQTGRYEQFIGDSANWGPGNRLSPKGAAAMRERIFAELDALSAAAASGLVPDDSPDHAMAALTSLFGYDPLSTHDPKDLAGVFRSLAATARATGTAPEHVRQLAESLLTGSEDPLGSLGAMQDFVVYHAAARRKGPVTAEAGKQLLDAVTASRKKLGRDFAGLYAIARNRLGKERGERVMQSLVEGREAMRSRRNLYESFTRLSGISVYQDEVDGAAASPEGREYLAKGAFVDPYMRGHVRNSLNESRKEALRRAGMDWMLPALERMGGVTMAGVERLLKEKQTPRAYAVLNRAREALKERETDVGAGDMLIRMTAPSSHDLADIREEARRIGDLEEAWADYRRRGGPVYTNPLDHILGAIGTDPGKDPAGWGLVKGLLGGGEYVPAALEHLENTTGRTL